jgi:hypothetical protein
VIQTQATSCITKELKNVEDLKKCQVDFSSIRVKNWNTEGLLSLTPKIHLDSDLEVTNPNSSDVTIYEFDFDIKLLNDDGSEDLLGKVFSEEEFTVPAQSKLQIPFRIRSEFEERLDSKLIRIGIKLIQDLRSGKETEFVIDGAIKYKTFLGKISLPVREIQKAKLKGN